jgi:hypothetical protein
VTVAAAQNAFPAVYVAATGKEHIAIASDDSVDPFVRIRVKVCASTGASDWLRALPGADGNGLLTGAQRFLLRPLLWAPLQGHRPRHHMRPYLRSSFQSR